MKARKFVTAAAAGLVLALAPVGAALADDQVDEASTVSQEAPSGADVGTLDEPPVPGDEDETNPPAPDPEPEVPEPTPDPDPEIPTPDPEPEIPTPDPEPEVPEPEVPTPDPEPVPEVPTPDPEPDPGWSSGPVERAPDRAGEVEPTTPVRQRGVLVDVPAAVTARESGPGVDQSLLGPATNGVSETVAVVDAADPLPTTGASVAGLGAAAAGLIGSGGLLVRRGRHHLGVRGE